MTSRQPLTAIKFRFRQVRMRNVLDQHVPLTVFRDEHIDENRRADIAHSLNSMAINRPLAFRIKVRPR